VGTFVQDLRVLGRADARPGLDLDNNRTVADEVDAVRAAKPMPLVLDDTWHFGLEEDFPEPKLDPQRVAEEYFEIIGPEHAVDLHGRSDDGKGPGFANVIIRHVTD
jgi:hypothetical protein